MDLRQPVPLLLVKNEAFYNTENSSPNHLPNFLETDPHSAIKQEPLEDYNDDNRSETLSCSSPVQQHFLLPSTHLETPSRKHDRASDSDVDIETVPDSSCIISTLLSSSSHPYLPMSSRRRGRHSQHRHHTNAEYSDDDSVNAAAYIESEYDAYNPGLSFTRSFHNYAKNPNDSLLSHIPSAKRKRTKDLGCHRIKERLRRKALFDLMSDLSKELPILTNGPRLSKRKILDGATSHIQHLEIRLQDQENVIFQETEKNMSLRAILQYLQLQSYPKVNLIKL